METEIIGRQFVLDLGEIYDAEQQFLNGMLEMEEHVADEALDAALRAHILQTKQHIKTLDRVYEALHEVRQELRNEAAAALVTSAHLAIQRAGTAWLRDTAVVTSAIKNEQYEIASYRSLITTARVLGHEKAATMLRENLHDEEQAASTLEEQEPRLAQQALYQEQKEKQQQEQEAK